MSAPRLLTLNPELQRCLWLELTPTRLILMPVLLAVIFGGFHLAGANLADKALAALWVLLSFWGSRLAADSFAEEVVERTWDIQRLSASRPWSIVAGKLLGGTAYAWYGAAFCILALLTRPDGWNGLQLVQVLEGGLVSQAAALFVALALHRLGHGMRRRGVTLAQFAGLFAGSPFFLLSSLKGIFAGMTGQTPSTTVIWYGHPFGGQVFSLVVLALFGLWYAIGATRLVRREMGFRDGPLAWSLFTAFAVVLCGGLAVDDWSPSFLLSGAASAAAVTYIGLLASPLAVVEVKRLHLAILRRDWRNVWRQIPFWLPSAVLAIGLDLGFLIAPPAWMQVLGHWTVIGAPFRAAWLALLLRDISLVCWLRLTFPARGTLAMVLLFVLLYGFFPWVSLAAGYGWRGLLMPDIAATPLDLIGPWLQGAGALALLWWRCRKIIRDRG